ncbi:MAG TPA: RNA polymerase sigma factor [Phycisphaerales bacterium]|nr:RNA polymerase sigma factor [Phycisphaerales bacterium]HRQ74712.1 RNA polymerase sigma factor [Phycisphaerales bacterium]
MLRTAEDIFDEWLVLSYQTGEPGALRELVARWQTRLYRHARRLIDRADAAEDVTQEAWLAIMRGLMRLDDPACFGPWAYRIVTNKCRDWVRHQKRQRARGVHEDGDIGRATIAAPTGSACGVAAEDDEILELRRAMRELSPIHRSVLALHYLDGMGVAAIAIAMGVPQGTIKSRLHHARERLRANIEHNERNHS